MSEQKINPELMLKAAEMAIPGKEWCRPIIAGHPDYNGGQETEADYVAHFDYDGPEDLEIHFNPLTSDDDAMKLERALKGQGWSFGQSYASSSDERYWAQNGRLGVKDFDDSDTLLLLKCVSSMTGIPLYRSDK